jgi:hypothetical protein
MTNPDTAGLDLRQATYIVTVLAAAAQAPHRDTLWWTAVGPTGPITLFAVADDAFGDSEPLEVITPDTVGAFQQAHADTIAAAGDATFAALLYCARQRGRRPRRHAYPVEPALWPLFDACGPEHPLDQDGAQQDEGKHWYAMHNHPPGGTRETPLRHAHHRHNGGHGGHNGLPLVTRQIALATQAVPDD